MLKNLLIWLIRGYSYIISPLLGRNCRFYPTCSAYAQDAINKHGAVKGSVLATKRLCKCHPYYKGEAMDCVPSDIAWRELLGYKRRTIQTDKN